MPSLHPSPGTSSRQGNALPLPYFSCILIVYNMNTIVNPFFRKIVTPTTLLQPENRFRKKQLLFLGFPLTSHPSFGIIQ